MNWLPRIRFALIFVLLGIGFISHFQTGIDIALPFYIGGSLLLVVHLLFGDVWLAFRHIQHGRIVKAQSLLDRTAFPQLLIPRNRAYYYFGKALLAMHEKEFSTAEQSLESALKLGLFRTNDRALAQLNLAHLHYVQAKFEAAEKHLKAARAENPTDLMIKQQLEKMEIALAEAN